MTNLTLRTLQTASPYLKTGVKRAGQVAAGTAGIGLSAAGSVAGVASKGCDLISKGSFAADRAIFKAILPTKANKIFNTTVPKGLKILARLARLKSNQLINKL
jgi:hypothetical protein